MADYWDWNEAVFGEFFTGQWAGKPVYLDVEDGVLERLAGRVGERGDARTALSGAVRRTLHLGGADFRVFKWHREGLARWKLAGRISTPPFLALLAVLSRAAEEMRKGAKYTAGNYMGPLGTLLGYAADDKAGRQKLYRDFTEDTHPLWNALNQWLDDAGGSRGIPTARVFDWRIHVGLPISQALVKQADRERLPQLFADFGLRPHQRMSPEGMHRLLADWLPASGLSGYSKGLWTGGGEGRQRLVEVVCVALETWDGTLPTQPGAPGDIESKLRLKIRVRHQPLPRIDIALVAQAGRNLPSGHYFLMPEAPESATAALGGRDNTLEVHDAAGETWVAVSVPPEFSPPDLLLAALIVKHPSGARLTRRPRALIVCERDEEQRALIEADRVQLGHDTVLISHNTIADKVEAVLAASARPGFNRLNSAEGLPSDWCLFTEVQLVGIPATDDETLLPLIPIAWSQVAFGEGLQLPGTLVFHTRDTPELRVSSLDEAETDVQIACLQTLDPGFHHSSHQLGRISGSGVIPIGGLALRDGDYFVELSRHASNRAATTAGATFRLRSANWPRPLTGPVSWIGTPLSEGVLNPAGAVALEEAPSGPGVQGARAALPAPAALPVATLPSTLGQLTPPEPEEDMDLAPVSARSTGHVACVIGGAHHWLLPTVGRSGAPKWMKGTCKGCGITKWYPRRPPPRDYAAPLSPPAVIDSAPAAAIPPASARPIALSAPVADFDLLLDALSYARRGTWGAFERLADQMSELPWFASETARTLSALGHIDLVADPDDLRPQQWAIAPATLAATQDGAVLCGQRSQRLVDAFNRRVGELGGTLHAHSQANAPTRISISGVPAPSLARVAAQVSQDIGLDVQVAEDSALKLSGALPRIDAVALKLNRFPVPDGVIIQRFDFGTNTWVEAHRPLGAGAYRLHTRPYAYGVLRDGTDTLLRADNRWSKWLAAAVANVTLLAYDPAFRQLTCRLGAQLPGLYERAAVLASGWAPQPLTDATVAYRGVPPEVATAIWSALCDHRSP